MQNSDRKFHLMQKLSICLLLVFLHSAFMALPALHANELKRIDSLTNLLSMQSGAERLTSLIALSEAYSIISMDKSLKAGQDAIAYAEQQGLNKLKANVLSSIAKSAHNAGDFDLSLDYYQKALELYSAQGDMKNVSLTTYYIGQQYFFLSKLAVAEEIMLKSLDLGIRYEVDTVIASAYNHMGTIRYQQGIFEESMDYFNRSALHFQKMNDEINATRSFSMMGLIHWQWDENEKALEILKNAIEVFERRKLIEDLGLAYNNMGIIYLRDMQDYAQAYRYLQQSLQIRENTGNPVQVANVLVNLGVYYGKVGQFDNAEKCLRRAIQTFEAAKVGYNIIWSYYELGEMFFLANQHARSASYMETALMKADEFGINQFTEGVISRLLDSYTSLNDFPSFLRHFQWFRAHADTLQQQLLRSTNKEAQLLIQNTDLQLQLERQTEEQLIAERKLSFITHLLAAIIGLIFTSFIVLLILRVVRKSVPKRIELSDSMENAGHSNSLS